MQSLLLPPLHADPWEVEGAKRPRAPSRQTPLNWWAKARPWLGEPLRRSNCQLVWTCNGSSDETAAHLMHR